MKYKQPGLKPEKLQKLIDLIERVIPFAPKNKQLDMHNPTVFELPNLKSCNPVHKKCGTVHCFAGWVYIALHYIKGNKIQQPNKNLDYYDGIQAIDNILGISLRDWVKANPKLWDNKFGSWIFVNEKAFYHKTKRPYGADNLSHIRDHLVELKPRLIKKTK